MAGIFQRLFKTGQAEAHAIVDKMEDPIKMSEQAIRDLKKDLHASMQSLAEVKALAIRMQKDADNNKHLAADYERKAMLLLQQGQGGQMEGDDAERLAREALARKEEKSAIALRASQEAQAQQDMVNKLQANVNDLKSKIGSYENDLVMLKARSKTANATRKINQRLSSIDSSGTVSMLERMKEKVEEQEALGQAYGELADTSRSVDDEIDKALQGSQAKAKGDDSLAELKAKMGIQ